MDIIEFVEQSQKTISDLEISRIVIQNEVLRLIYKEVILWYEDGLRELIPENGRYNLIIQIVKFKDSTKTPIIKLKLPRYPLKHDCRLIHNNLEFIRQEGLDFQAELWINKDGSPVQTPCSITPLRLSVAFNCFKNTWKLLNNL